MINPGIFERPNFVIIVVIGIIMTWKGTKIPKIKNEYIKAKAFFLDKLRAMMTKLGLSNIPGLIILYLAYAIPQTLFLYVGYIKTAIPEELDEAAEIDGCGKFRMYFQIAFPLMKPMHATTLIINALWIWNDFLLPLLILNKDNSNWTLPLFQYNYQGQYFSDYGPSFASYVVGIIVILIVYLIFQKNIISGMTNGSVK